MDILRHDLVQDQVLRMVRYLAEKHAGSGAVPVMELLLVLSRPRQRPVPGDAEALAAYRKAFDLGNHAAGHLAECGRCQPGLYVPRDWCAGFDAAVTADQHDKAQHLEQQGGPRLAEPVQPGARMILLDRPIGAVPAVKLGNQMLRSTEAMSTDPDQRWPSATIWLASPLRMAYEQGEIVSRSPTGERSGRMRAWT
jgi:hypothetical protein